MLGVPLAVAVFAGASSPFIAQRLPRLFFPALAIAGGALFALAFGRAVNHAVRQYRRGARVPALSLLINGLAVIVIVVLPLTRVVRMLTAPAGGPPRPGPPARRHAAVSARPSST